MKNNLSKILCFMIISLIIFNFGINFQNVYALVPNAPTALSANLTSSTTANLYWTSSQLKGLTATGGTITYSGSNEIHTFSTSGTYNVTHGSDNVKVLILGGGGSGGSAGGLSAGGGGGSGGYYYNSAMTLITQAYSVILGATGSPTGGTSSFNGIFEGGGGSGGGQNSVGNNGVSGGSGGGGGTNGNQAGGSGSSANGFSGKSGGSGGGGSSNCWNGGGGGGSSGSGTSGTTVCYSGSGGAGTSNSITGSAVTYGAGGNGGAGTGGIGGAGSTSIIIISNPYQPPVSGYKVERSTNNSTWSTINSNTGNTTTIYHDTGLSGGTTYYYRVSGINSDGTSTTSNVATVTTQKPPPNAPVLSKANTQSSTAITPSWSASAGAAWYLVKRTSPAGGSFSQVANVSSLSYADSGLTPGDQYQYEVIAGNSSGTSSASNMKSNYTSNIAPTALSASLITYLSERTTWTNPTGNSSSFKIEDSTGTCSSYSTVTSDTGNTTNKYDLTSLTGNTKVCVRVSTNYAKGTNSSGTSSPSSVLSFYTLPAPPTGLTVTQTVSKQAHLSWTAPSDNGTVLGYFIEFSTNGGSTWSTAIANTGNSTTHFDHAGLTAGLTYTYRVSTIQYSGTSVPSATASKLIFQGIIINAFESDGTTTFAGNIIQSNSTSKNNVFPLVQGTVGLNGLIGNQNFTVKDSNNFVVFKDYNFNATSTGSASYSTHIYRVDCPSTLAGNDIKLEVNDTDGHRISSFNTPTCDSNNLVTFGNVFTGNGNSALSYSSQLLVTILNSTFNANPVSFSMNSVPIGTSYNSATEVATSPSFVIGSGLQTFSETFSLQLNKVITLSGVGSIGGGGSVGSQSLGSSPVSPNNTSQLNTINPPRMTAKFATNPMTGKFGQLLNGTMTLTWQNSKNLIVNSISVGDYVRWIFYPNQPFNLIGDTIYQNSATAYVADIPFNVQVPAMSCQLNMTASLGCAENNNQYDIPVKLNISVNGQQYVISSTLSVIVSNSPVNNPIVAYSVIGLISVLVLFALFRTKGGKPKRTSKYSKNENDLGKSKTAKELDKVLKKKK